MKYKIIDRIIACLIIAEMAYYLKFFADVGFYKTLFTYYSGISLILIISRVVLIFLIGIVAIIAFFRNLPSAKWALCGYIAVIIIGSLWKINPNTDQYMEIVKNAQTMVQSGRGVVVSGAKVVHYPYLWVIALYIFGLIYAFLIRKKV
jgi:FlaA1/EpsC-like NDP-sugar epimerase